MSPRIEMNTELLASPSIQEKLHRLLEALSAPRVLVQHQGVTTLEMSTAALLDVGQIKALLFPAPPSPGPAELKCPFCGNTSEEEGFQHIEDVLATRTANLNEEGVLEVDGDASYGDGDYGRLLCRRSTCSREFPIPSNLEVDFC